MRLVELRLKRTPGIRVPFTLTPHPGVNLVSGPNGIGKSSVCRAVRQLLWPETAGEVPFEAEAEFDLAGQRLTVARRDLAPPEWTGPRPDLGPDHLAGRYRLGPLDLLVGGDDSHQLAREIRRHLAGGFDLAAVGDELFAATKGQTESRQVGKAEQLVRERERAHRALAADQDRLTELRQRRDLALRARDRRQVLQHLLDLTEQKTRLRDADQRLREMTAATEHIRQDDAERLARLRKMTGELGRRLAGLDRSLAEAEGALAELRRSEGTTDDLPLDLLKRKVADLTSLQTDLRAAEREAGDRHLEQVLGEKPPRTSAMPYLLALGGGLLLIALHLTADTVAFVPDPVALVLGIVLATAGLTGLLTRPRDSARAAVIEERKRELARRKDRRDVCRRQWDEAMDDLNRVLGEADLTPVAELEEADIQLNRVAENRERRRVLAAERERDLAQRERDHANLAERRQEITEIFQRLGLPDTPDSDPVVTELIDLKPAHDRAARDRQTAAQEVVRLTGEVERGRSLLHADESADLPPEGLRELIARETERADELEELSAAIADIDAAVKRARGGFDLQEARAGYDQAREELLAVREARREAALGRLLLDRVALRHEEESRPPVLARAAEFFGLFTGHRYTLEMARQADGEDRFLARSEDAVGTLELDELSDGTRAQLLLAVKLAFITAGEQGARPPIFLDDSLGAADPERFAVVAASLGRLAAEDRRQIFYLTANPGDVAAFRHAVAAAGLPAAHHLDLGDIRGLAGAVDPALLDPAELAVAAAAPDPAGLTAVAYARALRVPRPDPWDPPGRLHVFHLVNDELDLVRRLVDGNAPTLGRFEKRKHHLTTAAQISASEAEMVTARGAVWRTWLDLWRVGRARPVPRGFLDNSVAVSTTYLAEVTRVLTAADGDAAALIAALEGKAVKGFRSQKLDQLRRDLREADLLPNGEPLREDELLDRTIAGVTSRLAAGQLDMPKVRTLALTFAKIIETGAGTG